MTAPISRRQFAAHAAALGVGALVLPRHLLGGVPGAPSRTLNLAMIGGGGMGASNASALVAAGHRIVALADVDLAYADKTARDRSRNGQTGAVNPDYARLAEQYGSAKRYTDFRRLIEREKGIDGVVVATPDHVHAVAAKMAMDAGKAVYVQKPLTYSVHEARVLRETAARTRVVTQMGNQGHSSPEAQLINTWVRSGKLGPVRTVHAWTNRPIWPQGVARPAAAPPPEPAGWSGNAYTSRLLSQQLAGAMLAGAAGAVPPAGVDWDLYCGPAAAIPYHPVYHPFNWRGWVNFGVGALGDMGAHLVDHPYWALGLTYPDRVEATSSPWGGDDADPASYPQAMLVHYDFPARGAAPPVRMSWYDGGLMPERPAALPADVRLDRTGGVLIVGDRGVLLHETYGRNPRIFPEALFREVAPDYVEARERARRGAEAGRARPAAGPPAGAPAVSHEAQWANAVMGQGAASCPLDYAGPLTETMLLGIVALRAGQGRTIAYDGARGEVTNAPEANALLRREYRAGWSL